MKLIILDRDGVIKVKVKMKKERLKKEGDVFPVQTEYRFI